MSTLIRNRKYNSVILPTPSNSIMLMPRGDSNQADTVLVDSHVIESASVQEAIRRELIEVVPADEVDAVLSEQDAQMDRTSDADRVLAADVIERKQNRDLIGSNCIGPGPRPTLPCNATLIRSKAVSTGDAPPLCDKHQHLAHEFYQTEVQVERTDDGTGDSGPVTAQVWRRVEMTSPRRNLA